MLFNIIYITHKLIYNILLFLIRNNSIFIILLLLIAYKSLLNILLFLKGISKYIIKIFL